MAERAYDLTVKLGIVVATKDFPFDLSFNRNYFDDFGGQMSTQLKEVFTQIDSLNKEEQIKVFHYLEQRLQENNQGEDNQILDESVDDTEQSAYDLLAEIGVIGAAKNLPPDLSSNKKYLNDFGRS